MKRGISVTLGVSLALAVNVARADPRPAVAIVMAGDASARAPTETVLRELLGRLDVDVRITERASIDPAVVLSERARPELVARVWIDLTRGDSARFYLLDADATRVFIRTFPLAHGLDEVARETLGRVVEDAVDALLHGARIGVARETLVAPAQTPASLPVTAPTPGPRVIPRVSTARVTRFHFGTAYELQARGESLAHGAWLYAGASRDVGALRVGGRLAFAYRAPGVFDTTDVSLRMDELSLRAMVMAEVTLGTRVALGLAAGGGIDLVTASPHANDAARVEADVAVQRALPVARAEAGVVLRVSERVRVHAAFTFEAELSGARYYVDRGAVMEFVSAPWSLRPGGMAGAELRF